MHNSSGKSTSPLASALNHPYFVPTALVNKQPAPQIQPTQHKRSNELKTLSFLSWLEKKSQIIDNTRKLTDIQSSLSVKPYWK
jgi:hypothetical protein